MTMWSRAVLVSWTQPINYPMSKYFLDLQDQRTGRNPFFFLCIVIKILIGPWHYFNTIEYQEILLWMTCQPYSNFSLPCVQVYNGTDISHWEENVSATFKSLLILNLFCAFFCICCPCSVAPSLQLYSKCQAFLVSNCKSVHVEFYISTCHPDTLYVFSEVLKIWSS